VLDDGGGRAVLRAGCVVAGCVAGRVVATDVLGNGELLGRAGRELVGCGVCAGVGEPDALHADAVSSTVASAARLRRVRRRSTRPR
jgi:hypothetical protein